MALTKIDGDARGGAALSIVQLTDRPIMFVSTGEKLEDFDLFHPDRMAGRILDLGYVLTLIEQAEKAFDAEQPPRWPGGSSRARASRSRISSSSCPWCASSARSGTCSACCPAPQKNRDLLSQVNDKDLDRAEAIVRSMTPEERRDPKIINGSRRARIAKGSGVRGRRGLPAGHELLRGPEADARDVRRRHPGHARAPRGAARRRQERARQEGQEEAGPQRESAARRRDRPRRSGRDPAGPCSRGAAIPPGLGGASGLANLPPGLAEQLAEGLPGLQPGLQFPPSQPGNNNVPAAFRADPKRRDKKK